MQALYLIDLSWSTGAFDSLSTPSGAYITPSLHATRTRSGNCSLSLRYIIMYSKGRLRIDNPGKEPQSVFTNLKKPARNMSERLEGQKSENRDLVLYHATPLSTAMSLPDNHDVTLQTEIDSPQDVLGGGNISQAGHPDGAESSGSDTVYKSQPKRTETILQKDSSSSSESTEAGLGYLEKAKFAKYHKLSLLVTTAFVLAGLTLPCCIAFISFLWSNPSGARGNDTWDNIVLSGWTLKSITISTMVLRVAIGTQAV